MFGVLAFLCMRWRVEGRFLMPVCPTRTSSKKSRPDTAYNSTRVQVSQPFSTTSCSNVGLPIQCGDQVSITYFVKYTIYRANNKVKLLNHYLNHTISDCSNSITYLFLENNFSIFFNNRFLKILTNNTNEKNQLNKDDHTE